MYEFLLGLRYIRAKRRNRFISFISLISMGGITLGVMALIVVLSVMNGFQTELRSRILAAISHVEVTGQEAPLGNWRSDLQAIAAMPSVLGVAPFVNGQGLLARDGEVQGVMIRGIDPEQEPKVSDFQKYFRQGTLNALQPGGWGIILGAGLARRLQVKVGDAVTLITPQGTVTAAGLIPRLRQCQVVGIFELGHYEYDTQLALMQIIDAQKLYRLGEGVSGLRIKLQDLFQAPLFARQLAARALSDVSIRDWTMVHANLFRAVQLEKRMMFIILTLIVAVAAFNLVSTLVMLVTDKTADIAILRTLGATPRSIMLIFTINGVLIGALGTLMGVLGGVLIATHLDAIVPALEHLLGVTLWDKSVYYINFLPSELQRADVVTIGWIAFCLTWVATLYPSWRAARLNPAEALRYE